MAETDPRPEQDLCARPEIAALCPRVEGMVSKERYEHIQRVARLAVAIARANGFPRPEAEAACLAALLHDAARDLPPEELFRLAPPENSLEEEQPLSVHGRAARVIAAAWGVDDLRVLEAIEGHVFGVGLDNRIGMAVYIADVCEPGRGVNDDIRELAMEDLTAAYEKAVGSKVRYLRSKGKSVHPATLEVYEQICHQA